MSVFFLCTRVIRPVAYGVFAVFVTSLFGERLAKATEIKKKKRVKEEKSFTAARIAQMSVSFFEQRKINKYDKCESKT